MFLPLNCGKRQIFVFSYIVKNGTGASLLDCACLSVYMMGEENYAYNIGCIFQKIKKIFKKFAIFIKSLPPISFLRLFADEGIELRGL